MFWEEVVGSEVLQGDYLPGCKVAKYDRSLETGQQKIVLEDYDLIVITQSCDLQQNKVHFAAGCPIFTLTEFSVVNTEFAKRDRREELRKGRIEGLHLLGAIEDPASNMHALVVDFREIYSLPVTYLRDHAARVTQRWRLRSPYLEHFSQAFARFFMRVGLPTAISPFR